MEMMRRGDLEVMAVRWTGGEALAQKMRVYSGRQLSTLAHF
jgi:hypothetical protein